MRVTRLWILALMLFVLVVVLFAFGKRIAVSASKFWATLHPASAQTGGVTIIGDNGSSEIGNMVPPQAPIASDFNDHIARQAALMARMPRFNEAIMPPGIRWFRYHPAWYLDTAMETTSGQVWVTYWLKTGPSRSPEYLGRLYGGTLSHFALPQEPYYFLKLDIYTGRVPIVDGLALQSGRLLHWAVLPNGGVVNSLTLPQSMRGADKPTVCRQGDPREPVALYGLLPNGQWRPILTWRAWLAASWGIWQYSSDYPLECVGRFAGYFWVTYGDATFRVRNGEIVPVTSGRTYLATDHDLILAGGEGNDWIIEAHAQ